MWFSSLIIVFGIRVFFFIQWLMHLAAGNPAEDDECVYSLLSVIFPIFLIFRSFPGGVCTDGCTWVFADRRFCNVHQWVISMINETVMSAKTNGCSA